MSGRGKSEPKKLSAGIARMRCRAETGQKDALGQWMGNLYRGGPPSGKTFW